MPLDPSITLYRGGAAMPDLFESYDKAVLAQAQRDEIPLRRQALQQSLQSGQMAMRGQQMQIAAQERALKDDEELRKVMFEAKGDPEQMVKLAQGRVSPDKYFSLVQSHMNRKKLILETGKVERELGEKENSRFLTMTQHLMGIPYPKREADWPHIKAALESGFPDLKGKIPDQPLTDEQLHMIQLSRMESAWYDNFAKNTRDQEKHDLEQKKGKIQVEEGQLGMGARTVGQNANWQQYAAWLEQQPPEVRDRYPAFFSPEAVRQVQRMGMTANEQTTADQRTADFNQRGQHHQQDFTQRGQIHKENMATTRRGQDLTNDRGLKAIEALAGQRKSPEAYKKDQIAIDNIRSAIAQYRTHLMKYDSFVLPGSPEYAELQTAFTNLQMRLKDAYGLGAITGPDMSLMNSVVTDPASLKGRWAGQGSLTSQMDEFEKILNSSEDNLRKNYGQDPRAPGAPNPAQALFQRLMGVDNAAQ